MPAPTRPVQLRCNYFENPLGVHDQTPRLSWRLATDGRRGARQTAYRITVSSTRNGRADLWNSGRVASDATTQIPYAGKPLASRQRAWWQVEVWDEKNRRSESSPAFWETGLLHAADWLGEWIGSSLAGGPEVSMPSPYVRTIFNVSRQLASARLYVTALGCFEFELNGRRVGRDEFTPGWTDYAKRVQYIVYDVAALLKPGANAAGAILGDGWYAGRVGWRTRGYYGDRPKLLAQLVLTYADGATAVVATDSAWKVAFGPITESDIMAGETYDARRELPGWSTAGYDDRAWLPVTTFPAPAIDLSPVLGPPVRVTQEIKPVAPPKKLEIWPAPVWIYDLGQNMVGRVRLRAKLAAGQTVRLRFAEVLNPDGTLYTENLRAARCTDFYTAKGDPQGETWEPRFTFHGFRYVELEGLPGDPLPDAVTGVVLHSDTPRTGDFSTSDPLINQLQRNIDWGQRGNFLEVPTDCPQRNERLGWMGDAQVFCRTAAWNRDVAAFFNKWQRDIADAQGKEGQMPSVAPHIEGVGPDGGPAWADAAVICPWTMYLCYGDKELLARHFASLEKFIAYMEDQAKALIRSHPDTKVWHGYGDWLALDGSGNVFGNTPKDLIGTALFCYSTDLVAKMARVLGRTGDAVRHEKLAARIRRAYQQRFLTDDGVAAGLTQTSYVLTLQFDLAPAAVRPKLMRELVRDIEQRGWQLTTGFVGASYLPHVLTRFGRNDVAYKLLHQKKWPSWLYAVTQGATTIWERWDGWTKEKGFQDKGMNSFNHYAYGAIGSWLYAVVAGVDLDPAAPAFKRIRLTPRPGGELTRARGTLDTPHGKIVSAWKTAAGRFEWEVTVPPNATATATFPIPAGSKITEGRSPLARSAGVSAVKAGKAATTCELAAGTYRFTATWKV
ncbi:MAG TPA: family 78 glycoside hydrolase catalytic domain [Opitutaceae bacterium]|nr:family 78 glycoside hydrolase catalytic domain [Opitutaceae bacterium]HRJ47118.1 family 78 glycoside hydrolase catalytic domain [Opitutaceae bacterium]